MRRLFSHKKKTWFDEVNFVKNPITSYAPAFLYDIKKIYQKLEL
jgi:hypothetical protein